MPNIGQQHSIEKSRQLQRNLYLAAKKDKQRRFHALYDRIFRLDILWRAWKEVRENMGSVGIDNITFLLEVPLNTSVEKRSIIVLRSRYRKITIRFFLTNVMHWNKPISWSWMRLVWWMRTCFSIVFVQLRKQNSFSTAISRLFCAGILDS